MANLLVFVERQDSSLCPQSKALLRRGREIANQMGATLYASAQEMEGQKGEEWIDEAGALGADKVVPLVGLQEQEQNGASFAAYADLAQALSPQLTLLVDSPRLHPLAGVLANACDAALLLGASTSLEDEGLTLSAISTNRRQYRELEAGALASAIVATLSINIDAPCHGAVVGAEDADIIFFKAPEHSAFTSHSPPISTPRRVRALVCGGMGAADCLPQLRRLAEHWGAEFVATHALWQAGLASKEELIDIRHQHWQPQFYLICGASGSDEHLGALVGDPLISTIDIQPDTPSALAASQLFLADAKDAVTALLNQPAPWKESA